MTIAAPLLLLLLLPPFDDDNNAIFLEYLNPVAFQKISSTIQGAYPSRMIVVLACVTSLKGRSYAADSSIRYSRR